MDAHIIWSVFIIHVYIAYTHAQIQKSDFNNTCYDSSRCNCSTNFQVPNCMYVTIGKEHLNFATKTIDANFGGFNITQDNETDRFCFPSSPQLLHCEIRKYARECYEERNHVILLHSSDFSVGLGDYYLDQEANAYVCTEAIKADNSIPRCNYITAESDMYTELDNDSIYINVTDSILKRATYTIDSERNANICYPLSIQFLNCNARLYSIHSNSYIWLPKMRLVYKAHNYRDIYGPDEFYSLNTQGYLRICVKYSLLIEIIILNIYKVLTYISLVCLCVTIVYQLKTGQSQLFKKCLACYCATMMAWHIITNIRRLGKYCHNYFVFDYIVSLSMLTWLALMTFDIWKSFSSIKTKPNRRNFRNPKTFIYYSTIGWGSPVLLYVLVLITNHFQDIFARQHTISIPSCWFNEVWALFTFFYGPLLFISGINTILFVLTVRAVQQETKETKAVRKNGKKQMVIICIKLFFIMGVGMIMRGIMLSIQAHLYFHEFYISDAFNSTQGITVFIVVMCKRDTMRSLRNHYIEMQLKWGKFTTKCKMFRRKNENTPIYLVEENNMKMETRQISLQSRAYILHDCSDGDIFTKSNEKILAQISNETLV